MKKLLLFGSFFLISFFTGLVNFHGISAQSYGGDGYVICNSRQDCPPGKISDEVNGLIICCKEDSNRDTGHKATPVE